jgi:hypothetical protein
MEFLAYRTDVSRFWRQNNGMMQRGSRFIRFVRGMMRAPGLGKRCCEPIKQGEEGIPDIAGVLCDGRAFFVECKAPTKKPSDAQALFLSDVARTGAIAIVAWSIEDVRRALDGVSG